MTIDERRVTTALQAYVRGADVTDADLDRLEARVGEQLHPAPRRATRRPWEWAVAACAVLALVLAVTALWRTRVEETMPAATPTPSPVPITRADLAGVWVVDVPDSDGHLWHFTPDGRLNITNSPEEYVDLRSGLDPYTLGGDDVLGFPAVPIPCRSTVRLASDGRMTLTPIVGPVKCDLFPDEEVWPFIRVSPASVAGTALLTSPNFLQEHRAPRSVSVSDVVGTWLLRGTGTILVVVADPSAQAGQYVLDDDGDGAVAPDQRGTVTVRPDAAVVLRPSNGPACATVFAPARTTGDALVLNWADRSCGTLAVPEGTWIRLN